MFPNMNVLLVKSPIISNETMLFMQALATFGDEVAIAFSGAEDVAVVEYAHLTGRPFRVFRCAQCTILGMAPHVETCAQCHFQLYSNNKKDKIHL